MAPRLAGEDHTKDVDFNARGMHARREAGHAGTKRLLQRAPWREPVDPLEGVVEHH